MDDVKTVEILDQKNGFLVFDLKDILTALPAVARELTWHLLEIEALGKGLSGESILATEARVRSSAGGIELDFASLRQFAANLDQTINAKAMGLAKDFPPPFPPDHVYPAGSKFILVEMQDSSRGVVASDIPEVIHCIRSQFQRTTLVPAEPWR